MVPYKKYITVDRDAPRPVYMQVAEQLADAIRRGHLPHGQKLPGSRKMAQLLGLHRNTIAASYELLTAQGWTVAQPNRGTFVQAQGAVRWPGASLKTIESEGFPDKAAFDFKRRSLLDNPYRPTAVETRVDDGLPDVRLSHLDYFARLYHINMKRRGMVSKLAADSQSARIYYREQLTNYLNLTRGLRIRSDQLLVSRSQELGLYCIAEALLEPGDVVVVGELSYFATNMVFQKTGAHIQTVSIDAAGIRPDALEAICQRSRIRLLYVTPHHHYPTTVVLSEERRSQLLALAEKHGFIILEDDYDFDFNYGSGSLLPMAARDSGGTVIYTGTFGRALPTGFRAGFVVAPTELIQELEKLHSLMDRYGDALGEMAMGEMIAEGEMHRYILQATRIYRSRRDRFATLLAQELGHTMDFQIPEGGLAVWTKWPREVNLLKFSRVCAREGLYLPPYLLYQNAAHSGLRFGFGSLDPAQIDKAVSIMARAIRNL